MKITIVENPNAYDQSRQWIASYGITNLTYGATAHECHSNLFKLLEKLMP